MTRKLLRTSVLLALAPAAALAAGAGAEPTRHHGADAATPAERSAAAAQRPRRLDTTDLYVEMNATDGDAGLHLDIDGEPWERLTVRDPRGRVVIDVRARGPLAGYGATDLHLTSAEPDFADVPLRRLRARFREGRYTVRATTPRGRRLVGSDRLTHDFPRGPEVLTPTEDATVDPENLVVTWRASTQAGIRVVGYEVIVTEEATDRELVMQLGPRVTSATVPAGFLTRGEAYAVELLVRERSGNRTITEVPFRIAP